jgi:hypothetical protein
VHPRQALSIKGIAIIDTFDCALRELQVSTAISFQSFSRSDAASFARKTKRQQNEKTHVIHIDIDIHVPAPSYPVDVPGR